MSGFGVGPDRPVPLAVNLPPPGGLALSLRLGKMLGRGSSGVVYEAFVDTQNSSSSLASGLPPLVVKISYRGRTEPGAHEAYYYEALQPLQGVNIPRYYGRFVTDLSLGNYLIHSAESNIDEDLEIIDIDHRPRNDDDSGFDSLSEPGDEIISATKTRQPAASVSVLLLERLGPNLPMHVTLSDALMYVALL
jgi:hypothetical protein